MFLLLISSLYPGTVFALGKKAHHQPVSAAVPLPDTDEPSHESDEHGTEEDEMVSGSIKLEPAVRAALETIAHNYLVDIKSIFKQACFNCHTSMTEYPWYYSVPGIKHLIDHDVAEAREQLDFSNDYPFISHGELADDLKSIGVAVRQDTMPPFSYNLMHWTDRVSSDQKQKVLQWVDHSLSLLVNAGYVASAD